MTANLTLESKDLIYALRRVLPHVALASDNVPVLEDIHFTVRSRQLVLTATDRFTMIQTRIDLLSSTAEEGTTFRANGARLKQLLSVFKPMPRVSIDLEDQVRFAGVQVPHDTGQYPAVERLWPNTFTPINDSIPSIWPRNLKKLTAFTPVGDDKRLSWKFGQTVPTSPIVALFGHHTRVLVMPARLAEDDPQEVYSTWV